MKYKFKVGDKVKVIQGGYGIHPDDVGKTATIKEQKLYCGDPGYIIDCIEHGVVGEESFELISSKVLIFNDIYVGDIVVSLTNVNTARKTGSIIKTENKSFGGCLYYSSVENHSERSSSSRSDWRKATPEEIEAYNKGIRNINDIPKKANFEVGKWYKYNGWYGIFKELENGIFVVSEYIDSSKNYSNQTSRWGGPESYHEKILLTNLSEIQQYLPDGHVDKVKKQLTLINGRAYVAISTGNICRWKGDNSDYYFGGTYENPNTTFNKGNGGFRKNDLRDATSEEERWLFECILANKFIPKEEALEPSIPEYVECIKGKDSTPYDIIGKIYKVDKYNPDTGKLTILGYDISSIFFGGKSCIRDNSTDFKPSTLSAYEAQNKPKYVPAVGDWVVLTSNPSSSNFKQGKAYQLGGKYWKQNPGKFMIVSDEAGDNNGDSGAQFRKALPHEIPGQSVFPTEKLELQLNKLTNKKGFDEKEHLAKPYNQMLVINVKKQTKQKTKQLFL